VLPKTNLVCSLHYSLFQNKTATLACTAEVSSLQCLNKIIYTIKSQTTSQEKLKQTKCQINFLWYIIILRSCSFH